MKSLLTIIICAFSISLLAQGQGAKPTSASSANKSAASNCYEEWYSAFKERGAKAVTNGNQDVVITVRNGNYSECFMGKVAVQDGRVIGRPTIQKVDGTYEDWGKEVSRKYFNADGTRTAEGNAQLEINNGMTGELTLSDGDVVKLFFYQFVAEKPKANKKAPAPSALIKN